MVFHIKNLLTLLHYEFYSCIVECLAIFRSFVGVSRSQQLELLFNLHDKSAHYVLCSISVWILVTIFLTTLKTVSVSALNGKQICIAFSSSGEALVFDSG